MGMVRASEPVILPLLPFGYNFEAIFLPLSLYSGAIEVPWKTETRVSRTVDQKPREVCFLLLDNVCQTDVNVLCRQLLLPD